MSNLKEVAMDAVVNTEEQGDITDDNEQNPAEAIFTHEEARVIASLMEKELTTPNNYPLTANSLMLACNQKSNRDPVMKLTLGQVGQLTNQLRDREFIKKDYGSRAEKLSHNGRVQLMLDKNQQAVITVLMLRAPMTINDILTRTSRMTDFVDSSDVQEVLTNLQSRNTPLATLVPASSGRREDRYTHLLCGDVDIESLQNVETSSAAPSVGADVLSRIEALEKQVEALVIRMDSLAKDDSL